MSIEVLNISRRFCRLAALNNVSLRVNTGELTALIGPSGCGKTTLLRVIAGLENPDDGRILIMDQDVTHVDVQQRQIGFVFQSYALFRHMNVFENVAFGLRARPRSQRPTEVQIRRRVHDLLSLVQLERFAHRYPAQLSGGQRQRVALARALAIEPRILLLDEPFGALDASVRKELRRWLRKLHRELDITTVFVTHDQTEALEVADRIVIMQAGRVEQSGTPRQVWENPATAFVCGFLGDVNRLEGHLFNGVWQGHSLRLPAPSTSHEAMQPAVAFIRAHDFDIAQGNASTGGLPARLRHVYIAGAQAHLEFARLHDETSMEVALPLGQYVQLGLNLGQIVQLVPRHARIFTMTPP